MHRALLSKNKNFFRKIKALFLFKKGQGRPLPVPSTSSAPARYFTIISDVYEQ